MDVTKLVLYAKEHKHSFFIDLLYIVTMSLNSIEEMRMRIVDGKVVLHDTVNPTYTVMTKAGVYENCKHIMSEDYTTFYNRAAESIDKAKNSENIEGNYNDSNLFDEYYITCGPWLDFVSISHPLPDNNISSLSVPRVGWSKYTLENDKYMLTLNITVSHTLVDGYPLSKTFIAIQNMLNSVADVLKGE